MNARSTEINLICRGRPTDAITDAFEAHSAMSKQALASQAVRLALKEVLLGPGQLYEMLRGKVSGRSAGAL